jgi:glycyl-tRNA synthetase beta chain
MGEFFLEVRCEEIPARMLEPGMRELGTRLFEELLAKGLTPAEMQTGFTPRRLVLTVRGLPERESDREEERVGPPASAGLDEEGRPTAAAEGFARKCGVDPADLRVVSTPKGEYLGTTVRTVGRPVTEVLAELVPRSLSGVSWAKSMRWAEGTGPWVRPVHGIVALFDGEIVPFELFGIEAGDATVGHPIHSPERFTVRDAADYREQMTRLGVEVRFDERRRHLEEGMRKAATGLGGALVDDPELLDKLAAICGIPGIVQGTFAERYLELPREVLSASLRDHQSALTVESEGALLPYFLTVMDRPDDPAGRVRSGNEWVVEARLDDARFFYGEDRKRSLAERRPDLEHLVFHVKLGTYAEKTERIVMLTESLCDVLGWQQVAADAREAAQSLKVDLTTEMVKEFTSLQGVMGGVYAREDGLPEGVWQAIYDQYLPAGADDPIPRSRAGRVTAIADRIDTLVGMFGLGLVPSGSRDPFGLRRVAQGLVKIVLEAELPLDLDLVAALAARQYGDRIDKGGEEILLTLRPFLHDRVRYLLGRQGYAYDTIEAALAAGSSNLPDLAARIDAVHRVREEAGFLSVALAAKRIANIVKKAPEHEVSTDLLREPAEQELYRAAAGHREIVREAEAAGEYERCLREITDLAEVLDRFFVEVLVMDENHDLRQNRIGLLQSIQRMISRTARLTEVVVDKSEHRDRTAIDN